VIARGDFELAGMIGWPFSRDTLAVLPAGPVCEAALAEGTAPLEFFDAGKEPLVLLGDKGRCPLIGLITPSEGGG
jgi:hypothetical protein